MHSSALAGALPGFQSVTAQSQPPPPSSGVGVIKSKCNATQQRV